MRQKAAENRLSPPCFRGFSGKIRTGPQVLKHHTDPNPNESTQPIGGLPNMVPKTCSVPECNTSGPLSRGWCKMHYERWRRHGNTGGAGKQISVVSWAGVTCKVDECESSVRSVGYCLAHYKRFRRWGDPNIKRPTTPASVRFWSRVDKNGPVPANRPGLGRCWVWTAGRTKQQYGRFHPAKGRMVMAHRWSYEELVASIGAEYVLDHLCRNRQCVNPSHLEPVSNEENLRRGAGYGLRNGMRSACINGHEYTPENTYTEPTKGSIRCRQCARDRDKNRARTTAATRQEVQLEKAA